MDNRRLYSFLMAFDDHYLVPVKRFASKEHYGLADFERKATSICGGHLVQLRSQSHAHSESVPLPATAKSFLKMKWSEVRDHQGACLRIQEDQVVISGSQRQVEDGIKSYQRILSLLHCDAIDLVDMRAKDGVRCSSHQWHVDYPTVDLSYVDSVATGSPWLHLGGDAEEVAAVKGLAEKVVEDLAQKWESLQLPHHTGGYFRWYCKLPGKYKVDEKSDLLELKGNAAERRRMSQAYEELRHNISTKQLQVDDNILRSKLIGKEGVNIKQIRHNTSVHIHVGKDVDTSVRLAGPADEVERVLRRVRAFLQEHRQVVRELPLPPHVAPGFVASRLRKLGAESEARLQLPRDGTPTVKVRGNQRQVDYAEELLDELIYVKFGMVKLKVIKQLVSDFIVGKNGIHMRSLKGERDVHVQINDSPCHAWSDCFITGSLQDCVAVSEEISVRLRRRLE
ncbi:Vigilin [Durusdinium trenchii]|uniref:Vigilin n=1 Tax=Durusdinium trenchii TaxID=1381693 RepID=A0ABP0J4I5_9DINO